MPAIVHLTAPAVAILTRTTFDDRLLKKIGNYPSRFFLIIPAREGGEEPQVRGENITMITPLTLAQFEAKLEQLKAREDAAKEAAEKAPKLVAPRPGFRIPGRH